MPFFAQACFALGPVGNVAGLHTVWLSLCVHRWLEKVNVTPACGSRGCRGQSSSRQAERGGWMRRRRAARRARAIEAAQCAPSSSPNPRWRTVRGSSRERVLLLLRGGQRRSPHASNTRHSSCTGVECWLLVHGRHHPTARRQRPQLHHGGSSRESRPPAQLGNGAAFQWGPHALFACLRQLP